MQSDICLALLAAVGFYTAVRYMQYVILRTLMYAVKFATASTTLKAYEDNYTLWVMLKLKTHIP